MEAGAVISALSHLRVFSGSRDAACTRRLFTEPGFKRAGVTKLTLLLKTSPFFARQMDAGTASQGSNAT
jgi:hypothetical protein